MLIGCKSRGFISRVAQWLSFFAAMNIKVNQWTFPKISFLIFQSFKIVIAVHKSPPSHIYTASRMLHFTNLLPIFIIQMTVFALFFSYICFESSNKIHEWYIIFSKTKILENVFWSLYFVRDFFYRRFAKRNKILL